MCKKDFQKWLLLLMVVTSIIWALTGICQYRLCGQFRWQL